MKKNRDISVKGIGGHFLFDNQGRWASEGIFTRPTGFDADRYQKSLDEIFGLSATGQPICRVSWAWEQRRWVNLKFDEFGNALEGEWRQKYRALTLEIGNDEYVDIAPPRWVLEERFEPGQYEASWEGSRYAHIPAECRRCQNKAVGLIEDSTTCVRRDIWGAAPRDGWYNLLPHIGMVAEHESRRGCCDRLWKSSREICYGRYRVPDGRELQILRDAVSRRSEDKEINPHATLSVEALEQARSWGLEAQKEHEVRTRAELKDQFRDEVNTHGAKLATPQEIALLKSLGANVPVHREWFTN